MSGVIHALCPRRRQPEFRGLPRVMSRFNSHWERRWSGYVRSRNSARLARYQPAHKPRMQRAGRIALWLHACVFLVLVVFCLSAVYIQAVRP